MNYVFEYAVYIFDILTNIIEELAQEANTIVHEYGGFSEP